MALSASADNGSLLGLTIASVTCLRLRICTDRFQNSYSQSPLGNRNVSINVGHSEISKYLQEYALDITFLQITV